MVGILWQNYHLMNVELNEIEKKLLDILIRHFPFNETFSIEAIQYGLIDNLLPPELNYQNKIGCCIITSYLTQNDFAEGHYTNILDDGIRLTDKGRVLVCYGSLVEFLEVENQLKESEIKDRVPILLEFSAFMYGSFPLIADYSKVDKNNPNREQLMKIYRESLLDEHAMIWLIRNGFAYNRHELATKGILYRELTEKGRKLKDLRKLEIYDQFVSDTNRKKETQERRTEYLYWVNFWIAVGTSVAALYYLLEISRHHYPCYYYYFHNYLPFCGLALLGLYFLWKLYKHLRYGK